MAAVPAVAFPFKGSDGATYTGQTSPLDASGNQPTSLQGVATGVVVPVDTIVRSTASSRSGTITTGGTAQQLMAANASRRGFSIQNQSTGNLYFNGTATATTDQNSFLLVPGDYFESSPQHSGTGVVSIIGATTGQAFYAREF